MTPALPPADVFKTLSDPTRLSLLERMMREGELTVGALTAGSGVSQPAVSQHLAALKAVRLVRDRKEGRTTHYAADPSGLKPVTDWLSYYAQFWATGFDRLEQFLNQMDQ